MNSLRIEGRLRVYAVPEDLVRRDVPGDLITRVCRCVMDNHNLIVDNGLAWVSRKLGHAAGTPPVQVGGQTITSISELQVSKMKVGNASAPASPSASDTALADLTPLVTLTSITVSYPSAASVRFRATIPMNTQNGQGLTELGLFCTIASTDVMIGRLLFNPVTVVVPGTAYQLDYDITCSAI